MKSSARRLVAQTLARLALLSVGLLTLLTVVGLIGVLAGSWRLVAGAAVLSIATIGIVIADSNRQVRRNALRLRRGVRSVSHDPLPTVPASPPSQSDQVGLARILQAQYVGRLDRAQSTLDDALAELRAAVPSNPSGGWHLAPDAQVTVTRLDDASILIIRSAVEQGHPVVVVSDNVAAARARLAEVGLASAVRLEGHDATAPAVTIALTQ